MTTPNTPVKVKRPGPPLWLSIGVFLLASALVAVGSFRLVDRVLESQSVDSFEVPGAEERVLDPGEYDVFALAGSVTDFDAQPTFGRSDITVTWVETNTEIPVDQQRIQVDVGRQLNRYESVAIFRVDELGTYRVDVDTATDSRAVVARSAFASFDEIRVPLVLAGVGLVLLIVAVLMIIIGIIRRSRAARAEKSRGRTPGIYGSPPPTPAPAPTPAPSAPPPPPATKTQPDDNNTPW